MVSFSNWLIWFESWYNFFYCCPVFSEFSDSLKSLNFPHIHQELALQFFNKLRNQIIYIHSIF